MDKPDLQRLIRLMKDGGFYQKVMSSGPELDRVKHYLRSFEEQETTAGSRPDQYPIYPCFPGLRHKAFHDPSDFSWVTPIEEAFATFHKDAEALKVPDFLRYEPKPSNLLFKIFLALNRKLAIRTWRLFPIYYMGVDMDIHGYCSESKRIMRELPDLCVDYPWGDALFSVHEPGTHLPAHCSVDNLRVRCHLGLKIPDKSEIRVGSERRRWQEGRCLIFEDSIEHEVWNRSDEDRVILIIDFWHPDLTDIERRALTAGFMKKEIRREFFRDRIKHTSANEPAFKVLQVAIDAQESNPLISKFWDQAGHPRARDN